MKIQYENITAHICRIVLNRPEVLNAFDFEMIDEFTAAIERAHADPLLRVLVLTGAGDRGFCTGGDLKAYYAHNTEADGGRISSTMSAALKRLEALPFPTIAAINGHTRGGGAEVAVACDLRIISDAATIGFTHINVAVTTAWGGSRRLLRSIGYAAAIDLTLNSRVLTATEAHALRLVHRTAPPQVLKDSALAWARELAARPPQTVRAIKQIMLAGYGTDNDPASALEAELFPRLWAHPDHQELTAGFLNK
ncbi:MAG TPA: enoyl-CoA hydratase/isomerase family protein [Anaerolineales bacterium]|nr:enoyl-CoA hydratase/isomerase family protein [Anaerolineales bacterium]